MTDRPDYRAHLRARLRECDVPPTLHSGLVEYVAARRPTGSFLRACLENDLREACVRADDVNRWHLVDIVKCLNAFVTSECWGSPEKVAAWLADAHAVPEVFE
jgi:hypothetical protein